MTQSLSDMFMTARAPRVMWDGKLVYAVYDITPAPRRFAIELLRSKSRPVQGLALKIYHGLLTVNGAKAVEMNLWRDTAPENIIVDVRPEGSRPSKLQLWNIWRGSMGEGVDVTQAWLGNAGMRVDTFDDGQRVDLCCSDGEGPVDFSDLEVRMTLFLQS